MESVTSLPSSNANKTEPTEIDVNMDENNLNNEEGKDCNGEPEVGQFMRNRFHLSYRLPKDSPMGRGSVRRSVRNFELQLNGKSQASKDHARSDGGKRKNSFYNSKLTRKETLEKIKREFVGELRNKDEKNNTVVIKLGTEENDSSNKSSQEDSETARTEMSEDDTHVNATENIYSEIPSKEEQLAQIFAAKQMLSTCSTQTDGYETLKHRMKLVPLKNLDPSVTGDCSGGQNPMHVVSLNPKGKKGKNTATNTRLLKRRMSVSGDEQVTEKFSRITRFGSGLRKKLSASTRDIFGAVNSGVSSNPKDDTSSISSKSNFRRNISSSMRDLFGGSFTMKMDKEVRERGGKSEERRKEKSLKQSAFVIGGGITIGRSAGRRTASGLRDSFRDMLPKLRMTRVFEVNVILPDGTQTTVR